LLDDDMSSAVAALREQHGTALPEAALARKAVFEGVAFGAVLQEARSQSASREAAQEILRDLRRLMDALVLPALVKSTVIEEIEQASHATGVAERRRRQLALLRSPNPHGRAALAQTEMIDAFDQPV